MALEAWKAAQAKRDRRFKALPNSQEFKAYLNDEKPADFCRAHQERLKREALQRLGLGRAA
jgi:hypothetical protein